MNLDSMTSTTDKPHASGRNRKALMIGVAIFVLAVLVVIAVVGYKQPELLLDYVNLRYCG